MVKVVFSMVFTPNPDKPEKKKIFYHENTKGRNNEKDHEAFRIWIFGFRIYYTMNVVNINPYWVETVPGPLDPGIY